METYLVGFHRRAEAADFNDYADFPEAGTGRRQDSNPGVRPVDRFGDLSYDRIPILSHRTACRQVRRPVVRKAALLAHPLPRVDIQRLAYELDDDQSPGNIQRA